MGNRNCGGDGDEIEGQWKCPKCKKINNAEQTECPCYYDVKQTRESSDPRENDTFRGVHSGGYLLSEIETHEKKLESNLKKSTERLIKKSKDPEFIKLLPVEAQAFWKQLQVADKVAEARQNKIDAKAAEAADAKAEWAMKEHDAMIESLNQLFDSHDVDKNGTLSLDENCELMKDYISHQTAYAKTIFVKSCDKLMLIHIQLHWAHTSDKLKNSFLIKEGNAPTVPYEEFARMFTVIAKYLVMRNIQEPYEEVEKDLLLRIDEINVAIFQKMDKNHDSQISKEEFIEFFGQATKKFAEPSSNQYAVIHQVLRASLDLVMAQLNAFVEKGVMTGEGVANELYN